MVRKLMTIPFLPLVAGASAIHFLNNPVTNTNDPGAKYASTLLTNAKPTGNFQMRSLEELDVDLSGYQIKFQNCQFVKAYSDDMAEDADIDTVLGVQKFIIFRLCPAGSCDNCISNYGEYVIDMESYLEAGVEYMKEWQENMCNQCDEVCQADDDGNDANNGRRLDVQIDCDSCVTECQKIENMEDNGFEEASNYVGCQQIYDGDDGAQFYAGGMCSSGGSKIKIGVFSDEYCSKLESNMDVQDFLGGVMLSHVILKSLYNDASCISCTESDWDVPDDDADNNGDDEVKVVEMCENLYEQAAKCESTHGFDNYWKDYDDYANQYMQENSVCEFISSLNSDNYDQGGEIVIQTKSMKFTSSSSITIGQVLALIFYGVGITGFSLYAVKLFKQVKVAKNSAALMTPAEGIMA